MKKHLLLSGIITIFILISMYFIPIAYSKTNLPGNDQIDRTARYGFPLYFKENYSGGILGVHKTNYHLINVFIDACTIFGLVDTTVFLLNKRGFLNQKR
jgi:hypothetical protein